MRLFYIHHGTLSRRANWHRHFAWFPVLVATGEYRWLEVVERRGHFVPPNIFLPFRSWWRWRYRALQDENRNKKD